MGFLDPSWGGSSYSSYGGGSRLPENHPLRRSSPPPGAIRTWDIGRVYGPLPGDSGYEDPGHLGMGWAGFKEGFLAPLAGIGERLGLFEPGTREEMREDFEDTRMRYLSASPSAVRATLAGAAEIGPSAIPYAPAGTLTKASLYLAPRLAKYGLQGSRLAQPEVLSRVLAAGGGTAIGLGETAGGTLAEQALGIGLGAGLGSLAGRLDLPDRGIMERLLREDGFVDDMLGSVSGLPKEVEQQRILQRYKGIAMEQEAVIELNRARAIGDELGIDPQLLSQHIGDALTDPRALSKLDALDPRIRESVEIARDVADRASRTLIEPGGMVYESYTTRAERMVNREFPQQGKAIARSQAEIPTIEQQVANNDLLLVRHHDDSLGKRGLWYSFVSPEYGIRTGYEDEGRRVVLKRFSPKNPLYVSGAEELASDGAVVAILGPEVSTRYAHADYQERLSILLENGVKRKTAEKVASRGGHMEGMDALGPVVAKSAGYDAIVSYKGLAHEVIILDDSTAQTLALSQLGLGAPSRGASVREVKQLVEDEIDIHIRKGDLEEFIDSLKDNPWHSLFTTGKLMRTIQDNQGEYLTRAYQAFMDPDWAQARFREIREIDKLAKQGANLDEDQQRTLAAFNELKRMASHDKDGNPLPHLLREDGSWTPQGEQNTEKYIFDLLQREASNPDQRWPRGKFPKAPAGHLKKRTLTDQDRALRLLLGEDTNPFTGLSRTIRRLTADQEAYTLRKMMIKDLVDRGEASLELQPGVFDYQITGLKQTGLPPVYVADKQLAMELSEQTEALEGGIISALNYLSKAMATVMNPVTHGRNIIANPGFLAFAGHNPLAVLNPRNFRDSKRMLRMLDQDPSKALVEMTREELDELKEATIHMMERGLLENVDVSDLQRFQEEIRKRAQLTGKISLSEMVGNVTSKITRSKLLRDPGKKYAYEDFYFKNVGYLLERRRLRATGAFSDGQVRDLTIHSMERMLPTYSRISKLTEKFRKAQFIAPFVNFYSELIRTAKQSFEVAMRQWNDPAGYLKEAAGILQPTAEQLSAIRGIGAKRLAGLTAVMATPIALQRISQIWSGMSSEEDAAARSFMPSWSALAPVAYYGKQDARFKYVDLAYAFPHAALIKPGELAEPFTSFAIPISEAFEAYKDLSRASEMGLARKAAIVAKRGFRAFAPGFLKWGERVAKGAAGHTDEQGFLNKYFPHENRYGKEYGLFRELLSPLGRPTDQDVLEGLRWKASQYARASRQAIDIVNDAKKMHPDRVLSAIQKAQSEHRRAAERFIKLINNARTLGATDQQIRKMVKDLGTIPAADARLLMRGIVPTFRGPRWSR